MAVRKFEQYEHHGKLVWVRSDLKGRHREFCLCYSCNWFAPEEEGNCTMAEMNYARCVEWDVVLPVWECPEFVPRPSALVPKSIWWGKDGFGYKLLNFLVTIGFVIFAGGAVLVAWAVGMCIVDLLGG